MTANGRLGTGPVGVTVVNRGGAGEIAALPNVITGHCTRVLDGTSAAKVAVPYVFR